jgi:hypothetical protein
MRRQTLCGLLTATLFVRPATASRYYLGPIRENGPIDGVYFQAGVGDAIRCPEPIRVPDFKIRFFGG